MLEASPARLPDRRYDSVFERAEAAGQGLAVERREALGMLDELFQRPTEEWSDFPAERREARRPLFVVLLLEHATRVAGADPKTGEALARLAHVLTGWLDVATVPGLLRHELQVRAWILMGHARALRQEWQLADEAFAQASGLLSEATSPEAEGTAAQLRPRLAWTLKALGRHREALAVAALDREAQAIAETTRD